MKETPFQEYYKDILSKDMMSDTEFRKLITDYFLGFDYYITDSMTQNQANTLILKDIMIRFPHGFLRKVNDKKWLQDLKDNLLQNYVKKNQ